MVYKLFLSFTL